MLKRRLKKVAILMSIAFVVFMISHRRRLYLRDPLGSVTRDGVKEDDSKVYINYANDVLLLKETTPKTMLVVQHNQHAGTPVEMYCLRWTACLAEWDEVTLEKPMQGPVGAMSGKMVEFRDDDGKQVVVKLR